MNTKQQLEQVIAEFRSYIDGDEDIPLDYLNDYLDSLSAIVKQMGAEPVPTMRAELRHSTGYSGETESFIVLISEGKSWPYLPIPESMPDHILEAAMAKLNAAPQVSDGMVLVPEVLLRQIAKWLAESADPYNKAAYAINGLIAAAKEEG